MSGTGRQLPPFEFRSNYNQQISHDVPTQGRIWFNMTTVTKLHYSASVDKKKKHGVYSSSKLKSEDGKIVRL